MPGRVRNVEERARAGCTGRVDQDVATAEPLFCGGEHGLAGLELAQVAGADHRLEPAALDDGFRGRREVRLRGGCEHGLRALARERLRDRAADAAAAAGDDDDLAGEFLGHACSPGYG